MAGSGPTIGKWIHRQIWQCVTITLVLGPVKSIHWVRAYQMDILLTLKSKSAPTLKTCMTGVDRYRKHQNRYISYLASITMHVYVCTCMYMYVYVCKCICVGVCEHVWGARSGTVNIKIDTFRLGEYCNACICMYMYVHVCICICVGVCEHVRGGAVRYRKQQNRYISTWQV